MFSSLQHSLGRHSLFNLTCYILSGLTMYVRDRSCFTVLWIKIEQNSSVIVKFNAILGVLFMQIRYLIALICKLCASFYTKFWNFWRITRLSIVSRCKVVWSQKQSGFLAHPEITLYTFAGVTSRGGGPKLTHSAFCPAFAVGVICFPVGIQLTDLKLIQSPVLRYLVRDLRPLFTLLEMLLTITTLCIAHRS